jgi:capsular exopolysaccharide synthesis family protein
MQLRYYSGVIRHWLWFILLCTSVCAFVTFIISSMIAPTYQASTLIQVNGTGVTDSSSVFANQALAVSYALLITSNDVLTQVAQQIPGVTLQDLQANVSAAPEQNTQIIEIRATAHSATQAAQIANTVAQVFIALQIKKILLPLQNQSTQLNNLMATQRTQIDNDQAQLNVLQTNNANIDTLTRQRDKLSSDQANYNATLNSYQQVQFQILQVGNVISQVQVATPPERPSAPHVTLNTIVAALLGLLLSLALALLLDWLDTTIKTTEDVIHMTSLTPLGAVARASASPLVPGMMVTGIADEILERDFMAIGTGLCKVCQQQGQRVLLLTGMQSGSGTTLTATYLALTLAQMGKRVLLIDASLRAPFLHRLFLRQNMKGLANSVSEVYQFRREIVQAWRDQWLTHIPNLWFLPAGPSSTHPPTILRSQELALLLSWLLGGQGVAPVLDFVLFDAPALKLHADALALASVVSATLLVIEAGKERDEALIAADQTLQRVGAPVLGVIINRQSAHHHSSLYARNAYLQRKRQTTMVTAVTAPHPAAPPPPAANIDTPPAEVQSVGSMGSRLFSRGRNGNHAFSTTPPVQSVGSMVMPPIQATGNKQFIRR